MTAKEEKLIVQEEPTETVEVIILIPRDSAADWEWMQEEIAKNIIMNLEQEFIAMGRERKKVAVVFAAKSAPFYRQKPY